jgi:hypothetical protein
MPGTGSYVGPNINSDYIGDISTLLTEIKDNSSQLIKPKDVRDSVWTLWNRIDDVQILASQSASASNAIYYSNSNPTTQTVGGISVGSTFGGTHSIQEMFDLLLYPYVAPVGTLSIPNSNPRQFGGSTSVSISWTATKNKNTITSIKVDGSTVVPTGNTQTGTKISIGTHSTSPGTQVVQSFTMSVGDGVTTVTSSTTLVWQNKVYWGKVNLSSISNPNLTTDPSYSNSVGDVTTDSIIKGLTGAGVSPGSVLSNSFSKTYTNIDGGGMYLVFAWPSVFGTPKFTVNGLLSTAFTKVRGSTYSNTFSNELGFVANYDVWVSNTAQNSPLTIVIS